MMDLPRGTAVIIHHPDDLDMQDTSGLSSIQVGATP
jgi:hypothetical protein